LFLSSSHRFIQLMYFYRRRSIELSSGLPMSHCPLRKTWVRMKKKMINQYIFYY